MFTRRVRIMKNELGGSELDYSLDYLDPGYSTNGNLTISSNNRV